MEAYLVAAAGLWFILQSLNYLIAFWAGRTLDRFILFVYCLACGLWLVVESGAIHLGGPS